MSKFVVLCTVLFGSLFIVGSQGSLEAKHHNRFSFNIGTFFPGYAAPAYVPAYPQQYVERRVYMNPYGYPMQESVTVYPQPYYPAYYAAPQPVWTGFSFGARFR